MSDTRKDMKEKNAAQLFGQLKRLKKMGMPAVEAIRAAMQNKGEGSVDMPKFIQQLKQHIDQHSERPGATEEQRLRDLLCCVLVQRRVNVLEVEKAISVALQQSKGDVTEFTKQLESYIEGPGYWDTPS